MFNETLKSVVVQAGVDETEVFPSTVRELFALASDLKPPFNGNAELGRAICKTYLEETRKEHSSPDNRTYTRQH